MKNEKLLKFKYFSVILFDVRCFVKRFKMERVWEGRIKRHNANGMEKSEKSKKNKQQRKTYHRRMIQYHKAMKCFGGNPKNCWKWYFIRILSTNGLKRNFQFYRRWLFFCFLFLHRFTFLYIKYFAHQKTVIFNAIK